MTEICMVPLKEIYPALAYLGKARPPFKRDEIDEAIAECCNWNNCLKCLHGKECAHLYDLTVTHRGMGWSK